MARNYKWQVPMKALQALTSNNPTEGGSPVQRFRNAVKAYVGGKFHREQWQLPCEGL